ncbi:hypothetical protein [Sphaerimonospora thailandensis]|uniref:Uncharacterized protein n=1 Tax=Sphaerimonospora thailandensis TaxID=795644 RepID=A0A8J3R966_9ACTN|nr:hypothetical protein [Sphaerimonospora thailandensis]GIH70071.1 hypothetical protein Mth01_23240 [Sphaerimonospora thailandensis]
MESIGDGRMRPAGKRGEGTPWARLLLFVSLYSLSVLLTMVSFAGIIHPYAWMPGNEEYVDPDVALGALVFAASGFLLTVCSVLVFRKSWLAWILCGPVLVLSASRIIEAW